MYIMNALSIKNKTHPHTKKQPSTSGDQHHKPDNIIKHCYCISKHHLLCMAVRPSVFSKTCKVTQTFSIHTNTHTHLIKCCFGSENIYFLTFILLSYTQTYNVYHFIMASTHFYVPGLWHHHLYHQTDNEK